MQPQVPRTSWVQPIAPRSLLREAESVLGETLWGQRRPARSAVHAMQVRLALAVHHLLRYVRGERPVIRLSSL